MKATAFDTAVQRHIASIESAADAPRNVGNAYWRMRVGKTLGMMVTYTPLGMLFPESPKLSSTLVSGPEVTSPYVLLRGMLDIAADEYQQSIDDIKSKGAQLYAEEMLSLFDNLTPTEREALAAAETREAAGEALQAIADGAGTRTGRGDAAADSDRHAEWAFLDNGTWPSGERWTERWGDAGRAAVERLYPFSRREDIDERNAAWAAIREHCMTGHAEAARFRPEARHQCPSLTSVRSQYPPPVATSTCIPSRPNVDKQLWELIYANQRIAAQVPLLRHRFARGQPG